MYTHAVVRQLKIPVDIKNAGEFSYGEYQESQFLYKENTDIIVHLCQSEKEAYQIVWLLNDSKEFNQNFSVKEI